MQKKICAVRRVLSAVLGAALFAVSSVSAAAQTADGPGTDVWVSVVPRPTQERISVTLPAVVAFVVNGTADTSDQTAVSMENGTILLPNVKVEAAENKKSYTLVLEGSSTLVVRNYSTDVPEENRDDASPPRVGIGVTLTGTVQQTEQSKAEDAQWTPVGVTPPATEDGFKQYLLSLDGNQFNKTVSGGFEMEKGIEIGAPPAAESGWTAGGMSRAPFEQEVKLGVQVGGTRGMYNQAETSVKAAKIIWKIKSIPLQGTP